MSIEDIESHRAIKCGDSYRNAMFNLACTQTIGYILNGRHNIKSFGNTYTVVSPNGDGRAIPRWSIECDGGMSIILSEYATGDKCLATVMDGEEVCIRVEYQFTNPITLGTEMSDVSEELYCLITALPYSDKIKELKDMQGSGMYMLTEQDIKSIIPGYEPAEVVELR